MIVVLGYERFDTQTQWKQLAITILALTTRFDKPTPFVQPLRM